jgi:hypothetical protein
VSITIGVPNWIFYLHEFVQNFLPCLDISNVENRFWGLFNCCHQAAHSHWPTGAARDSHCARRYKNHRPCLKARLPCPNRVAPPHSPRAKLTIASPGAGHHRCSPEPQRASVPSHRQCWSHQGSSTGAVPVELHSCHLNSAAGRLLHELLYRPCHLHPV